MRKIIVGVILLLIFWNSQAQSNQDTIVQKKSLRTLFMQNGKYLSPKQLLGLTRSLPVAFKEMQVAKMNFDIGAAFSCCGGVLVGWTVGTMIAEGKPDWKIAGLGAGLIVIGIPFSKAYGRHARKAVRIYNDHLKQKALTALSLAIGVTHSGFGIKMTF